MTDIPAHASTQAALGNVRSGIIRNAIQGNVQPDAGGSIAPFSFTPPGGTSGWKRVRISNYTPYLFQVIGVPGGGSGDSPQMLQPFQQNVWNYVASRGQITLTSAEEGSPLAVPPLRFAYGEGTATGDLLFNYVTVEWTDTPDLFFGYYPVPLTGVDINAEALRNLAPVPVVIPVGVTPVAVATDPTRQRAYVANSASHTVTVINTATNTVYATLLIGFAPTDVAVDTSNGRLYVSRTGSNSLIMFQGNFSVGTVDVGASQTGITVDSVTHKKYVSLAGGSKVAILNATDVHTGDITVGAGPSGIDNNPVTGQVYVANTTDDTVTQIDEATDLVVGAPIVVGNGPVSVTVDSVLNRVYVANSLADTVSHINGVTALVVATIAVGDKPVGLDVDMVTSKVYVADQNSNSVSVIDETTDTITATFAPGVGPTDVAVNATTNLIYVTIAADAVAVLQGV